MAFLCVRRVVTMNIKLDIPDSFFQGEERCGYYVSPEMKRVWAVELDLIAEFSRVCTKHNLQWYADAGTLLGAVRHGGFIPWDDDIDLIMMRKDYEKLREIAPDEFTAPYVLKTPENEPCRGTLPWAKFFNESTTLFESGAMRLLRHNIKLPPFSNGIFADIFVLDDVPDDLPSFREIMKKAKHSFTLAQKLIYLTEAYAPTPKFWKRHAKQLIHYILGRMNISGHKYLVETMNHIRSYTNPYSKNVAALCTALFNKNVLTYDMYDLHELYSRSCFDSTLYFPFEMLNVPVPSGYKKMLKNWYGDWQKYVVKPPHGLFYDTEHSYTYYIQEGHKIDDIILQ